MRLGVFAEAPSANGGVFRYVLTLLQMLRSLELDDDLIVLHGRRTDLPLRELANEGFATAQIPLRAWDLVRTLGVRVLGEDLARRVWYNLWSRRHGRRTGSNEGVRRVDLVAERWLARRAIDVMFYPVYSSWAFEVRKCTVATIHDLNHRFYTEFPEVVALGEYERREHFFRNVCKHAAVVLADSETGREDVLNCYSDTGISADRVVVLPMLPSPLVLDRLAAPDGDAVRRRYGLREDFLFYPAQFWPHKNHLRLVKALHHLKHTTGETPVLALGGSHHGWLRQETFRVITDTAHRLGLSGQMRYLGFIPDADMAGLYSAATALIMPTFFGPTNIPILEAFAAGCPVITSDIRGIREQAAGAAILIDPRHVESIADGIKKVLSSREDRDAMVARGRRVLDGYTVEDYQRILRDVVRMATDVARRGSPT